jgi:hypothetical protein
MTDLLKLLEQAGDVHVVVETPIIEIRKEFKICRYRNAFPMPIKLLGRPSVSSVHAKGMSCLKSSGCFSVSPRLRRWSP